MPPSGPGLRPQEVMRMTEEQWLHDHRSDMVRFLEADKQTDRKWPRFACAFCRKIWHRLAYPWSRRGVEIAEQAPDGLADGAAQEQASAAATAAWRDSRSGPSPRSARPVCAAEAV